MGRAFRCVSAVLLFAVSAASSFSTFAAQDSLASPSPASPQTASTPPTASGSHCSTEPKKTKKVWTNENLAEVSGSAVSQIGDAKNGSSGKSSTTKPASPQVVATFRKQLAALQTQLTYIDKQIADLKSFSKGEASGANGLQMHKSYTMEPIPDQVQKLEEKRKMLAVQMDAVFDVARKRGIEPGQLR
jgi:hypothetical protein